jgi:predicted peptidase
MKMKTITITLMFVVAGMLLHFTSFAQGSHKAINLGSTDAPFGFYEYLPKDYNANGQEAPLLIFLHGSGEKGNGKNELDKAIKFGPGREIKNGRHFPFVILSPQTSDHWNVKKLDDLIKYARKHYNIDKDRIYLTGLSMGAMGLVDYI